MRKQTTKVVMLLLFLVGVLLGQEAGVGQNQVRCGEQVMFQFPENEGQSAELWKVDFQELVNSYRLNVDDANRLWENSEKAREAQGKTVKQFKIAFDSCARQWIVELKPYEPTVQTDQIWPAAMQVAANAVASQQPSASTPGGPAQQQKSTVAGKFLRAIAFPLGFVHPFVGAGASALAGQFDRRSGVQSPSDTVGEGRQETSNDFQPLTYADRWVGSSSSKIR